MSAFSVRARDRAIAALRSLTVALVLLAIAATGALSGLFARQYAESARFGSDNIANPSDKPPAAVPASKQGRIAKLIPANGPPRHFLVVVHRQSDRAAVPAPTAGPAPVVTAPQQSTPPVSTSSGSDAS